MPSRISPPRAQEPVSLPVLSPGGQWRGSPDSLGPPAPLLAALETSGGPCPTSPHPQLSCLQTWFMTHQEGLWKMQIPRPPILSTGTQQVGWTPLDWIIRLLWELLG